MKFVLGLADLEKDTPRKVIKCELGVKGKDRSKRKYVTRTQFLDDIDVTTKPAHS